MTDCIQKDRTRRVRLFPLDSCGRIMTTGAGAVLDYDGFETIGFSDQITAGERETITTTSGATCRDKTACPTDLGQNVSLNECTESWTLMALAGYGTLELSTLVTHPDLPAGTVIGFNRSKISCDARMAMEIIFDLDAACDDSGNTQCVARLYPMLDRGVLSGDKTVNGKNVVRGSYTFTAQRNARVFDNFTAAGDGTHPPTGELAHWAPWIADIELGDTYYIDRLIDCPTLTSTQACELRALVV